MAVAGNETTVIRVPTELVEDIKQFIAHYKAVGRYASDTTRAMEQFRAKTGILKVQSRVVLNLSSEGAIEKIEAVEEV